MRAPLYIKFPGMAVKVVNSTAETALSVFVSLDNMVDLPTEGNLQTQSTC
jgi:hypothetical protein